MYICSNVLKKWIDVLIRVIREKKLSILWMMIRVRTYAETFFFSPAVFKKGNLNRKFHRSSRGGHPYRLRNR